MTRAMGAEYPLEPNRDKGISPFCTAGNTPHLGCEIEAESAALACLCWFLGMQLQGGAGVGGTKNKVIRIHFLEFPTVQRHAQQQADRFSVSYTFNESEGIVSGHDNSGYLPFCSQLCHLRRIVAGCCFRR